MIFKNALPVSLKCTSYLNEPFNSWCRKNGEYGNDKKFCFMYKKKTKQKLKLQLKNLDVFVGVCT